MHSLLVCRKLLKKEAARFLNKWLFLMCVLFRNLYGCVEIYFMRIFTNNVQGGSSIDVWSWRFKMLTDVK